MKQQMPRHKASIFRSDSTRAAILSAAATSALILMYVSLHFKDYSETIRGENETKSLEIPLSVWTNAEAFFWVGEQRCQVRSTLNTARPLLLDHAAWNEDALQILLSSRVCGSPAVEGYAHVDARCLERSPTNSWWQRAKPRPDDLLVHVEKHADYDGLAVAWGIGNTKATLKECAKACKDHIPPGVGPYGNLPCNAFTWCTAQYCWEPDVHPHKLGDCWLKFTEGPASPEVSMRGNITEEQRQRHFNAPDKVPWHSGVLLPRGVTLTNGTWGPRYDW